MKLLLQYLVIIGIVIGILLVVIAVFAPAVFGEDNPLIPDALEPRWHAIVRVGVAEPMVGFTMETNIETYDIVYKSPISTISVGPLFITEKEGKVVIESMKGGLVIDRVERPWHIGRFEVSTVVEGIVLLGKTGTGDYTIRAITYRDGSYCSEDSVVVTI